MKAFFTNMRCRQALTLPNGEVVSLAPMRYYLFPEGTRTSGIEGLTLVTLSPGRTAEVVDLSGAKEEDRPSPVVAPVVAELEERGGENSTKGLPFAAAVSESLPGQDVPKPVPVQRPNFVPKVPKRQKP
jgi:hypothetical protein